MQGAHRYCLRLVGLLLLLHLSATARGEEALIAVAANFSATAAALARDFGAGRPHTLRLAAGSTGKLYAQIRNGAPYDAFLAADTAYPSRLEADGLAVPGTRFTYVIGRLGLWVPGHRSERESEEDGADVRTVDEPTILELLSPTRRIALANPRLAPYGAAARQVLERLQISTDPGGRLVYGENVAQAYAMVASGAADAGLLAWALLVAGGQAPSAWLIPQTWHDPIRQDAVLLVQGKANAAARAFLEYLRSDAAAVVLRAHGYDLP